MNDSKSGNFGTIIVHKLDRFARNKYDSAVCKRTLKQNKVKLVSVLENIDDTPEGGMMEGLL